MTDDSSEPVLYCANHPNRQTNLRCNRCNKPICTECAVLTPTGYRCRECVRLQQKTFDTAVWFDYPVAVVIAGVLGYIGSVIAGALGFFTIFIAPVAGVIIAEGIRLVIRKHRSKLLYQLSAAAAGLGSLPRVLILLLAIFLNGTAGGANLSILLSLAFQILFTFLVVSTVYYRLRGISLSI